MVDQISSRPFHDDSITQDGETPTSKEYNLFFDDVENGLNSILGDGLKLPDYTVATVPDASDNPNAMIFVTDETGGAVPAFSRGSDWRRVTDGAIIS